MDTAHALVLRLQKLKGRNILREAARHNLREIQAELGANSHIDSSKTRLNTVLVGASIAADVVAVATELLQRVKKPPRRDAVMGLEIVVSLPPSSGINELAFFNATVDWSRVFFEVPQLSAVVHLDESAPHCHIIMLPVFDGRMVGGRLMGNRQRLEAIQADFFEKVGHPFGLKRKSAAKRLSHATRVKAAAAAVEALRTSPHLLTAPVIRDALRDALAHNPDPATLVEALGMELPKRKDVKPKTFVSIMTKRFKPEPGTC